MKASYYRALIRELDVHFQSINSERTYSNLERTYSNSERTYSNLERTYSNYENK